MVLVLVSNTLLLIINLLLKGLELVCFRNGF